MTDNTAQIAAAAESHAHTTACKRDIREGLLNVLSLCGMLHEEDNSWRGITYGT